MAVAHLALNLRARHQRRNGVHNDDVDRVGAHKRLGDLERLLAGVRLGNEQGIDVHAERGSIDRVERMLDVDERGITAHLLPFRDAVQRERRLTGGFRPVDLDDSAARQAADAERKIQRKRARGDGLHLQRVVLAEPHHGALAELLLDLRQRRFKRLDFVLRLDFVAGLNFFRYLVVLVVCHVYILAFS